MTAWERAGRPKPPPIYSTRYVPYARRHRTLSVQKWNNFWEVRGPNLHTIRFLHLADAFAYADQLIKERSQE